MGQAIASAHANPHVQAMWARYAEACEYVPLNALSEAQQMFAGFEPIAL